MPKDRDQMTPEDPEDAEHLATHRGQGSGSSGLDQLSQSEPVDGVPDDEADDEATSRG